MDRRTFLQAAIGAAVFNASCSRATNDDGGAATEDRNPEDDVNVVVIYADDMRLDELPFMPFTESLTESGTSFEQARQMTPLCSPARAGFMRGQYATGPNGHGIVSQASNYAVLEEQMLPVWLTEAGVTCGLVGKYFVGLARSARPGWSFWRSPFGESNSNNRGYVIGREDGTTAEPDQQQAHYFAEQCTNFIEANTEAPWFLWYCPNDPHFPLEGTTEHREEFVDFDWPEPPTDVAGKPRWVQELPAPAPGDVEFMRSRQRLRLRELADLDDTVAAIWEALVDTGQQDRTVLAFTSDNGNALLDHRIPTLAKNAPYDVCMRVPLIIVGPGFDAGARADAPVAVAQDLTATVLDLFGVEAPIGQDGRSLREPLAPERALLGHCGERNGPPGMPPNDIVVAEQMKLVRYREQPASETFELYDLDRDPQELENLAHTPTRRDQIDELSSILDEMLDSG